MIILSSGAQALLEVISVRAINWISQYTIVPQLSKGLKFEAVRRFGGIKLFKGFEFKQTNKQDTCVYLCSQNGSS